MGKSKRTIYYKDELNDDFTDAKITPRTIDKNYKYLHKNIFWRISYFFWYRVVATPLGFLYCKLKFRHKIVGKEKLKIKQGFFIYGNHTQEMADAFIPSLVSFPKRTFVIVHPSNVSMPVLGRVTARMGALPLPGDIGATKNFIQAVETKIKERRCVAIYPEAHIWPYYTKIRPFVANSFRYPAKLNAPVFSLTNTYQQKGKSKKVRIITYIDGPFYPDENLSLKDQEEKLRDQVYSAMVERSKNNNVEVIKYERSKN